MTHASLFSGIGGLDLAAEWAGFRTILQVESADYPLRVLEKHWPNVPRIRDIREVTSESVTEPVTVVSGGFPCQPFSVAGKRGGSDDDRYLWPEMLRVIRVLEPTWAVCENVSGLLSLNDGVEFEAIVASLEAAGYEVITLHYPAAGVGARHLRNRVFTVAHRAINRRREGRAGRFDTSGAREREPALSIMANSCAVGRHGRGQETGDRETGQPRQEQSAGRDPSGGDTGRELLEGRQPQGATHGPEVRHSTEWWAVEPAVGRLAYGIPHRVDRLRALGNAVVPQQAYPIFAAIAEVEKVA